MSEWMFYKFFNIQFIKNFIYLFLDYKYGINKYKLLFCNLNNYLDLFFYCITKKYNLI